MTDPSIDELLSLIDKVDPFYWEGNQLKVMEEWKIRSKLLEAAESFGYRALDEDQLRAVTPRLLVLMDFVVNIGGVVHGVELKRVSVSEYGFFSFFNGLGQTIAYLLNGVDYAWLVHYVPAIGRAKEVVLGQAKLVEEILEDIVKAGCIGYVCFASERKYVVRPRRRCAHKKLRTQLRFLLGR